MAIDYVRVWQRQGSGGKLNPDSSISAAADQSSVWPSQWGMANGRYPSMPMSIPGSSTGGGGRGGGRRMTGSGGQPPGAGAGGWFGGKTTARAPSTPAAAAEPGVCAVQVNVSASLTGNCAGIHVVTGDDGSGSDVVDGPDVQAAANKAAPASAAAGIGGGGGTNNPQYDADFKPGAAGVASSSAAYAGTATPTPGGRRAAAEAAEAGEAQHAHQQLHIEKQEESKPGRHGRETSVNVIHARP